MKGAASLSEFAGRVGSAFRQMVLDPQFSCLGARAAFNEGTYRIGTYDKLGSETSTPALANDLLSFSDSDLSRGDYSTFIAVFEQPVVLTEGQFEERLWLQLRLLHDLDLKEWDPEVARDPADSEFSFSFAGKAFYVLGMHANSSRLARRFAWPTLVFNPHAQFERLRNDGKWKRMQGTIRAREIARQGNINPMLSEFGEKSEARQYSGRPVADDWQAPFPKSEGKCPFHH
jgi:FPC/CPF motif-containing protein YcgG